MARAVATRHGKVVRDGGEARGWHYVQSGVFLKQGISVGKYGPKAKLDERLLCARLFGEVSVPESVSVLLHVAESGTSLVDPSAEIREGFANQTLTTTDGRTLTGFLTGQDTAVVVLRGLDGQDVSIARAEVRELRASPASLMPEGLLAGLSEQELRDFFAFLRIPQPISR